MVQVFDETMRLVAALERWSAALDIKRETVAITLEREQYHELRREIMIDPQARSLMLTKMHGLVDELTINGIRFVPRPPSS